jgi:hypothetical protein
LIEEKIDSSVMVEELNEKTISLLKEILPELLIENSRIIIDAYIFGKERIRTKKKLVAEFIIGYSMGWENHIQVYDLGYYDKIKEIGEKAGYSKIFRTWR